MQALWRWPLAAAYASGARADSAAPISRAARSAGRNGVSQGTTTSQSSWAAAASPAAMPSSGPWKAPSSGSPSSTTCPYCAYRA
ncbi:hypothetical protein G6F22_014016 [Rhizopus arrhizus]|nr:hypothetical protein G6F22_014016 [Rhizopus arrhizus]